MLSIPERVDRFRSAYADKPASWPWLVQEQGRDVLYACWMPGQDYRNRSRLYGAYPPRYVEQVMALFPDAERVLHAFAGSVPEGPYLRCDVQGEVELRCSVLDLPDQPRRWDLILADPPYSAADAERYGTAMVNRRLAMAALAHVTVSGGFLVWLDTVWPIHRKEDWVTVGRIFLVRSTNHRVRCATIFKRA